MITKIKLSDLLPSINVYTFQTVLHFYFCTTISQKSAPSFNRPAKSTSGNDASNHWLTGKIK